MNEETKLVLQSIISFFGAYLAARLATKKYQKEKWWERKVTAYASLTDALHMMKWQVGKKLDAELVQKDLSEAETDKIKNEIEEAHQAIWRVADSAMFLVSKDVLDAIEVMDREVSIALNSKHWFDRLDEQYAAIQKCLNQTKEIARKDLSVS